MHKIGIVGGGPSGLITAELIECINKEMFQVTLFESTFRLGGKISTRSFDKVPIKYEAGAAELYDYSRVGLDPVKELVQSLGLETQPIQGHSIILGENILSGTNDIIKNYGLQTLEAIQEFYEKCRNMLSPNQYYEGYYIDDNSHPWANRTFQEILDEIPDEIARKYVLVSSMSDVATESHLTSALDGLKNILMDDHNYLSLYSIVGGNELFSKRLAEGLVATEIRLGSTAKKVSRNSDGTLRLSILHNTVLEEHNFDSIVLALPNYWSEQISWGSRDLRIAMDKHHSHYASPAHYLRISILFNKSYWEKSIPGAFWMSDAFGGCCIYDESKRLECAPYGVLGWLISGTHAMTLGNLDDVALAIMALESLPQSIRPPLSAMIEAKVHRWIGAINGLPGGRPVQSLITRHQPEPLKHDGLFIVGDYLFDSTINGVYDSADFVTDLILTKSRKVDFSAQIEASQENPGEIEDDYFEYYSGDSSYEESFGEMFSAKYTADMIEAAWGIRPPYKILDCGSANGLTLKEFEFEGIEAWGIENNQAIHAKTPKEWLERNVLGDITEMPFEDSSFDFIYDTSLCYLPENLVDKAIQEMFRVVKYGVVFMGVVTDMTKEVIEDYELFYGLKTFRTQWGWSELFVKNGFRVAVSDSAVVDEIWKVEQNSGEDDWDWYPDKETMRYCFFSKPDIEPRTLHSDRAHIPRPLTPMSVVKKR